MKGDGDLAIWKALRLRTWIWGTAAATALGTGIASTQLRHVDVVVQSPSGDRRVKLWTIRSTVKRILAQAGISLNRYDRVDESASGLGQETVVVRKAIPVWIHTAHRHFGVWTTHYHVQNILKTIGIKLGPLDRVSPGLHTAVGFHATITVVRRWLLTRDKTVSLPYTVQYQPDGNLYRGNREIVSHGQNGAAVETEQILMQNGTPVQKKIVANRVITPPRPEVVLYGTRQLVARGGQVLQFSRELTMVSTAYWPNPRWSDGYTALGLRAHYGIVAVDPRVIPLGTRLYIPGYGFAVAADTGSAIVGQRIDLCYNDAAQAQDWGVRTVQVFVLQ